MPPDLWSGDFFSWWRYRTRTAAEATAACGGNREPRLGPRSDFSKPCQGAAEKSANATRTGASRQIPSRFPTPRNVYQERCRQTFGLGTFFRGGGTGLEQQRRRPPPAAETGSRGWGRVLIFQSPAKGLRKNQQTQPVQAPAVRFRQGSQRLGMSIKKDAARPFGQGLFCCAIHEPTSEQDENCICFPRKVFHCIS